MQSVKYPRLLLVLVATIGSLVVVGAPVTVTAGTGRVAVYPGNPHYLMDASGKPFLMLGYGDEQLDNAKTLDRLAGKVNYMRAYFAVFIRHYGWNLKWQNEPWAVVDGKVDMDTWQESFWLRLRHRIHEAQARHLVIGLTIWDGHTALPGGKAGQYSFWNADRNLQGVQWAYDVAALERYPHPRKNGGPAERLVYYQRRVIDRLLQAIRGLPNVIIELNNEDAHGASPRWWLWWAHYFKSKGYVVAVNETAGGAGALSDAAFAASPDVAVKFYHQRTDTSLTPARYAMNKVVVADADTHCEDVPPDRARRIAWKSVLRGGGWNDFVCMQQPFPNRVKTTYYGHLLHFFATEHIPFWQMAPMGRFATSGYALVKPGVDYLVYAEHDVTVNLAAASGRLRYLWYNPRSGTVVGSGTVAGGEKRDFTIPGANDYILWITSHSGIGLGRSTRISPLHEGDSSTTVSGSH